LNWCFPGHDPHLTSRANRCLENLRSKQPLHRVFYYSQIRASRGLLALSIIRFIFVPKSNPARFRLSFKEKVWSAVFRALA
jgi:hypothetical protein